MNRVKGEQSAHHAVQDSYEIGAVDVSDEAISENLSELGGIDRMRDEGGLAPEVPHREERVDFEHGSVNPGPQM
jgi:hypothetical protein